MHPRISVLLAALLFAGCATTSKGTNQEEYRHAVVKEVKKVAAQFEGGDFPFYHWTSPIVQDVSIPAHLSNGVMIPAHKELVIIKPGEWTHHGSYPIQSQQGKGYDNQISYMDMDVANITALPKGVGDSKQDPDSAR